MKLTKTDFIQYLNCPKSLWLLKHKPDVSQQYESGFSSFLKKLIREGYEVERYLKELFPQAKNIGTVDVKEIKRILSQETGLFLQTVFQTDSGLFARVDVLEIHEDRTISLYEVKSSTSIKTEAKHNHLKDVAFQKYVLEQNGYVIKHLYLIHLNKDFVKTGSIDPRKLLKVVSVEDLVAKIFNKTVSEIESALSLVKQPEIDETCCSCLDKTRANHCDTFRYFNRNLPQDSIYSLRKISVSKIKKLRGLGVEKISEIPSDFELSNYQILQRESVNQGQPIIHQEQIKETLATLKFPLYFFDYETLPFAIPKIDGYQPHQPLPVQYSLHILFEDGRVEHFEYLAEKLEAPQKLVVELKKQVKPIGTLISWNKSYEGRINTETAELYPEYLNFLQDINERTFDLMDIFKADYVDAKFDGKTSIKSVQPVLVPQLSYKKLEIQNGTMAIEATEKMFTAVNSKMTAEIRRALLQYCELDTLAMVEIYKQLITLK